MVILGRLQKGTAEHERNFKTKTLDIGNLVKIVRRAQFSSTLILPSAFVSGPVPYPRVAKETKKILAKFVHRIDEASATARCVETCCTARYLLAATSRICDSGS